MKNKLKIAKKLFFPLITISFVWLLSCCNQGNNAATNKSAACIDSAKKELWAELVESKTCVIKPEGWDDVYWNSVSKKMDRHKIFSTIVDAVISGKVKAYDILTDSILSLDEVKTIMGTGNSTNAEIKKINEGDLSMMRMREKWVFDKEKFILDKQVTRIDLLLKKLDETGEYIGDKPLFYVNLNKN